MDRPTNRVIPLQTFWDDLDTQLGSERSSDGKPSRTDFYTFELFDIIEEITLKWDQLPQEYKGRRDYRQLIGTGKLVRSYAVLGRMGQKETIELVRIYLDFDWS